MPGRAKGKQVVVIEPRALEGDLLPVCGAPGCRTVARPEQPLCDGHWSEQMLLAARRRLARAAPMAADVLADLIENGSSDEIRRRAAEAVLDRTGLRPGLDVSISAAPVEGVTPSEVLRARLAQLRERTLDVAEAASEP